jgi:hypothetical protein
MTVLMQSATIVATGTLGCRIVHTEALFVGADKASAVAKALQQRSACTEYKGMGQLARHCKFIGATTYQGLSGFLLAVCHRLVWYCGPM